MSNWALHEEPGLRRYMVGWAEPGYYLLSRRNRLYESTDLRQPFKLVMEAAAPGWKQMAAGLRPIERLLRFVFYNTLRLPGDRLFVNFAKTAGVFEGGAYRELGGFMRPCRVLRSAGALDVDGSLYMGEYILNDRRSNDIHIYRLPPGGETVEVRRRFAPGEVRHVHGIYRDPFGAALWCVTGDVREECRVMRSTDGFKTFETIGGGDESWRTVSLLFTEDAIYYATDAEFVQNRIYRIDRRSGRREALADVDGPVHYAHAAGGDLFFSVVAELCPSQKGRRATLWLVSADQCTPVAAFEKDPLPVSFFLPGAFYFPAGPGSGEEFFVHTMALRGADNRTFRATRSRH